MNSKAGSRSWIRFGLHAAGLVAAGSLGFLIAARPPAAAADGLLPTTVTVPTLPVSVPSVSLPTLTTPTLTTPTLPVTTAATPTLTTPTTTVTVTKVTTTSAVVTVPGAAAAGTTGGLTVDGATAGASTSSGAGKTAERSVAGAVSLPSGSISIPVTSVVAPNGLRLTVTMAPRVVRGAGRLTATIRVRDAHGYLVRGAAVTVRSIPAGQLMPVPRRKSAADGRAAFAVRAKTKALPKTGRLWLLVAATDPTRPKVSVTRTLALPIAARSR